MRNLLPSSQYLRKRLLQRIYEATNMLAAESKFHSPRHSSPPPFSCDSTVPHPQPLSIAPVSKNSPSQTNHGYCHENISRARAFRCSSLTHGSRPNFVASSVIFLVKLQNTRPGQGPANQPNLKNCLARTYRCCCTNQ